MKMEVDAPNQREERPINDKDLFKAAETGDSSVFSSLWQQQLSGSLSLRNDDGRSLLHVAASYGHPDVVKVLLSVDELASVVNASDEEGWGPIHSAVSIGNIEIVEMLLSKGADVNSKNDGGRTALHYAASKGRLKIAEVLISNGAKLNLKDKACSFKLSFFFFMGTFITSKPIEFSWIQFGCTALHRGASTGNSELCEFLIEEGAEVDSTDRSGQTPLMTAVICENKEVALLLIRHGADVDAEDKEGYTVLGRASNDFRPILVDAAQAMIEG